ncbi:ATP-binding protein [Roseomonas sp. AR75]|uniref:ATP-binding protein n=1 Tax=Roseomonas sp. AR75 TaxID=2562311 RepID=UPI001484DF98|nr:ATP-binding protein [Roseomonas sp. AR75]
MIELPLDPEGLGAAQAKVAEYLAQQGASDRLRYKVRLVLDEMAANLKLHGVFAAGPQPARAALRIEDSSVHLRLEDTAAPFDPRSTAATVLPPSLDDDKVGGLGLPLVRRMAEIRAYSRLETGWNRTDFVLNDA